MKIKDIKGIAEKLPKEKYELDGSKPFQGQLAGCNITRDAILSTDLDINDICEIDVEKIEALLMKNVHQLPEKGLAVYMQNRNITEFLNAIAKAGVLKWKENDNEG